MKFAIVILNWNGKKLLEQFLPTVIEHSKGAAIYVADNASTDDSVDFVNRHFPEVEIIQNRSNVGYAKGYNDALAQIKADIFCLLNSDVEVTSNWLSPILNEFESHDDTAIIQPKLLDYKRKSHFEYAGAAGGYIDKYGYPFCRGRIFNSIEEDVGQYNENTPIFWASGACFFIRMQVFNALNGFDEDYFAHFEEIDLCWRAFNLGYKTKYVGDSVVYHVGGATLQTSNPKKTYLNFRNSLFTITKNAYGTLFSIIMIRLILDGIAGIKFLISFKPEHFSAIVKAHFSFYRHLPRLLKQRKRLPKQSGYYQITSIVWSYYLKGKRSFQLFIKVLKV